MTSLYTSKSSIYASSATKEVVRNARYYHNICFRSPIRICVMHATFVVEGRSGECSPKAAEPLSIEKVPEPFNRGLMQLCEMSQREKQCVIWITIETREGSIVDHVMVLVDVYTQEVLWEGEMHAPAVTRVSPASERKRVVLPRGPPSPQMGIAQEMPLTPPSAVSGEVTGKVNTREDVISPGQGTGGRISPGVAVNPPTGVPIGSASSTPRQQAAASPSPAAPMAAAGPAYSQPQYGGAYVDPSALHEEMSNRMADMMSIVLLTSKAATKLISKVDDTQKRVDKLIDMSVPHTSGPTPIEVMDRILTSMKSMELRMRLLEEQTAQIALNKKIQSEMVSVSVQYGEEARWEGHARRQPGHLAASLGHTLQEPTTSSVFHEQQSAPVATAAAAASPLEQRRLHDEQVQLLSQFVHDTDSESSHQQHRVHPDQLSVSAATTPALSETSTLASINRGGIPHAAHFDLDPQGHQGLRSSRSSKW